MALTPIHLNGGTLGAGNGVPIVVAATVAASADHIHLATAISGEMDEIWLYATNISNAPETLYLEFGIQNGSGNGTTNTMTQEIQGLSGLTIVIPGLRLGGAPNLSVNAYASTTNKIVLSGNVNQYA
jgi:hypothetical protein